MHLVKAPPAAAGGGSGGVAVGSGCTATQSASQTIAITETTVAFDGADLVDTDGYHDPSTNNSRFTVPTGMGGVFAIAATLRLTAGDKAVIWVEKNGTDLISPYVEVELDSDNPSVVMPQFLATLVAGDYIELKALCGTTSESTVANGCSFTIVRLAGSDTIDGGTFADAGDGTVDGGSL